MIKYSQQELCLIWLDSFIGLDYKHKKKLYEYINDKTDIKALLDAGKEYLIKELGDKIYNTVLSSANKIYLEYVLNGLNKRNITAVTLVSEKYPKLLKETDLPPLILYVKGNLDLLNGEIFALVGSRKSLPFQKNVVKSFTEDLCASGFTLVTGIAQGIDETVLQTAIKCGGKAISVLASGFDNVYPKNHQTLVDKLVECGLVISEYPPVTVAKPYHFPIRNRIIAGLSVGVLVASADLKSGTMYTAEYANDYGRHLFSIPHSVGVQSGKGCNDLIKRGAILTDCVQDILDFYGKSVVKKRVELTDEEKKITALLQNGELHIDKICKLLNMAIYEILSTLANLEIKGVVVKNGLNIYGLKRQDLED